MHYGPVVIFVCLHITPPHYHHHADVSEGIDLLKCLSDAFLLSVCLRLSQFSQLSFMQYMVGLCVFGLPICLMMIMKICLVYLTIFMHGYCAIMSWLHSVCNLFYSTEIAWW